MIELEYYVLNYDFNRKKVENFNIFRNCNLHDATIKEIKKYIRSPKKYKYEDYIDKSVNYGFEAFCKKLNRLIMWQEWSRCEYEISVGDAFEDDCSRLEKWDCYGQCEPNIPMIAREVIWQYKNKLKEKFQNGV